MDSPEEEKKHFERLAYICMSPEQDITHAGLLSRETIEQVWLLVQIRVLSLPYNNWTSFVISALRVWQTETEVSRLTKLKASRMKELVLKKRSELEEECRRSHIEPDTSTAPEKTTALIDSGVALTLFAWMLRAFWHFFFFNIIFRERFVNILCIWYLCISGLVDPCELLANIEAQIVKVKEESISRKEIMDRISKWLAACEEENWLEQYNQVLMLL